MMDKETMERWAQVFNGPRHIMNSSILVHEQYAGRTITDEDAKRFMKKFKERMLNDIKRSTDMDFKDIAEQAYNNGYEAGKQYAAEKFAEEIKKELITLYLSKRCDEIYIEIMEGGVNEK